MLDRLTAALSSRYTIEHQLGAGGMATVYLAHDVKHDRKVAIKVLKPELAAVLGAERFVQEIKTTANLQHPHILPLFDSGEVGGFLYYVMPYIEGETLRDKLNRETQLGIEEAVKITTEIADALDYAHRQNVIHRDIKPENILLHDGRPLVVDFGIALAVSAAAGGRMTETGLSLGTPHYMSPEQATAEKDLTNRSDIYSLGAVLYEMLAGSPPHVGSSAQQIIMKIVTDEARPVIELRKSVPPHVAAAVAKALERLPADRFESAASFAAALTDARIMSQPTIAAYAGHIVSPSLATVLRAGWMWILALMVISAIAGWMLRPVPRRVAPPVTRFTIPVPDGHEMIDYLPNLAVSDDGRTLAYFAGNILYKRDLKRSGPEPLGQAVGGCCPRFSGDGQWIYFDYGIGETGFRGMSIDGGPIVDFSKRPTDEDIVLGQFEYSGILRRRAGDTTWVAITTLDPEGSEGAHLWPQQLSEGRLLLYTILGPGMMWNGARVVLEDVETGTRTTVVTNGTFGRYVPTGHVVYTRANGTVEVVPFDLRRREVVGSPFAVQEAVRTAYWGGAGSFAVSYAGTFAFVRGSSWENHRITWLDRRGAVLGHVGSPVTVEILHLSPDDRYIVTYVASPNADIARLDAVTGEQRRLTFDETTEDNPVWSPDGRRVAYRKLVAGRDHRVLAQSFDGRGNVEELYASEKYIAPRSWSPDGSALALQEGNSLIVVDLESQRVDTITRSTGVGGGRFSPDGRLLAYMSSETGRDEVYVVSYPGLATKHQISVQGGRLPVWAHRSGELFFVNHDTLLVAAVSTDDGFDWTIPRSLFVLPEFAGIITYAVSSDGQRILYPARNPDAPAREINVVLNWFEELNATGN